MYGASRAFRGGNGLQARLRCCVSVPIDGPFGRTFTFADPDGYQVTLHDRT